MCADHDPVITAELHAMHAILKDCKAQGLTPGAAQDKAINTIMQQRRFDKLHASAAAPKQKLRRHAPKPSLTAKDEARLVDFLIARWSHR